jgi:SAM-dependent methyltransferase
MPCQRCGVRRSISGPVSGFQAVALSDLGFAHVVAVDLSPTLLAELETRKATRPIETVECDLNEYLARVEPRTIDLVTCMGDTLTHLESRPEVVRLLEGAALALADGGRWYSPIAISQPNSKAPIASSPSPATTTAF